MAPIRILLIEDDLVDQLAFKRHVQRENLPYRFDVVQSVAEATDILKSETYETIISDYNLGDGTALDVCALAKGIPLIITTGAGNEEIAVKAMKAGVCDYLIKDAERNYLKMLPLTVQRAVNSNRAEKQMKMLLHAIMHISDSVYITGVNGMIRFANTAFCETYGYTTEEVFGMPASFLGEEGHDGECLHRRKDGTEFFVSLSRSIVKDESGDVNATVTVARDITERKHAEEALQHERILLRTLIDNIPDAIYVKDLACRKIVANLADLHNMGMQTEAEVLGKDDYDCFPRELADAFFADDQSVLHTGQPVFNREEYVVDPTGVKHWLLTSKLPLRDEQGQIVGLIGVGRDITEHKRAEEALRASEAQLSEALKISRLGYWERDFLNDEFTFNDQFYDLLHTTAEREGGYTMPTAQYVQRFIHPEDVPVVAREGQLATETTDPNFSRQLDHRIIYADGEVGYVTVRYRVLKDAHGRTIKTFGVNQDITERKRAEEYLRRATEEMHAIFWRAIVTKADDETTGAGGFLWNTEYLNPDAIHKFLPLPEEPGKEYTDVFYRSRLKEDRLAMDRQSADALRRGAEGYSQEFRIRDANGSLHWMSEDARIQRLSDTQLEVIGFITDITERKQAEEYLRRATEEMHAIFWRATVTKMDDETMGAGGFVWNTEYLNLEAIHKFLPLSEEPRKAYDEFYRSWLEEDRLAMNRHSADALRQGAEGYSQEFRIRDASGIIHWMSEDARIQRLSDTQFEVIGLITDITERKRGEEALRTSEEKYRDFFYDDLTGAFISKPDGKLLSCNPSFARIFGFDSIDEALRYNLIALYPKSRLFAEVCDLVRLNKKLEHYEIQLRRHDGLPVYVIQNVIGKFDESGELLEIKGYVFDNTRHKLLEEQLRQAQKMESIGTLAGGIAHDFNNILAIIMGHAQLLMNGNPEIAEKANSAETINRAVHRGAKLVKQILTFARRDGVVFEAVNLNLLVEELHKMLAETFPKMIDFILKLDPALPTTTADPSQVHQALLNLCVNAHDAMPAGGTLTIETELVHGLFLRERFPEAYEHLYALLRVSDTGTGMSQDVLNRMFEPFFTTKEIGKGTGLGLAVVYGVTKSHRGFVDVTSHIDNGTTFNLYFPIRRVENEAELSAAGLVNEPHRGNETILVVEDEEMLLELVKGLLENQGYVVLTAVNGEEALDIYTKHNEEIGLVLSDLGLPKIDGWEAFQRMKEINPEVKVIFASGYIDPLLRSNLMGAGAKGLVQKPYMPEEILNRVRELINSSADVIRN